MGGVKTLLLRVPLGTYTGWNPVPSGVLKGQEASLAAGYIPFAKTRAERIASGDPRLSLEERYGNIYTYYFLALAQADDLVRQGFLLPEDANALINQLLNNILANGNLPKILLVPDAEATEAAEEASALVQ
jgi:hypothetical protein